MQRTASETMKPPGNQPEGGAPVSGQSCCPPRPEPWEKMLVECGPRAGRPLPAAGGPGAHLGR